MAEKGKSDYKGFSSLFFSSDRVQVKPNVYEREDGTQQRMVVLRMPMGSQLGDKDVSGYTFARYVGLDKAGEIEGNVAHGKVQSFSFHDDQAVKLSRRLDDGTIDRVSIKGKELKKALEPFVVLEFNARAVHEFPAKSKDGRSFDMADYRLFPGTMVQGQDAGGFEYVHGINKTNHNLVEAAKESQHESFSVGVTVKADTPITLTKRDQDGTERRIENVTPKELAGAMRKEQHGYSELRQKEIEAKAQAAPQQEQDAPEEEQEMGNRSLEDAKAAGEDSTAHSSFGDMMMDDYLTADQQQEMADEDIPF